MATVRTSGDEEPSHETVVGPNISIRGRIEGEEDLRVEGRIEGSVVLTETLYVEPEGVVIAQVEARDVVVSGLLLGNVNASNSVTLNKGAKLVGNIQAPRLIIADGAAFSGDVVMGDEPASSSSRSSRATSTVSRSAVGGRARAVSGSYESKRPAVATPARREPAAASTPSRAASTPSRAASTPSRAASTPSRAAPKRRSGADDDDVTVVIKHAALRKGEAPPEEEEPPAKRRRAKKSARMPARGRRKVGRKTKD